MSGVEFIQRGLWGLNQTGDAGRRDESRDLLAAADRIVLIYIRGII